MSLKPRFVQAESDFLRALAAGDSSLTSFHTKWEKLCSDFQQALARDTVDEDEKQAAFVVASRIVALSEGFIDMQELTDSYIGRVENILSELRLHDDGNNDRPSTLNGPSQSLDSTAAPRPLPPYHAAAFSWLLANIHDPYPSSSLKRLWAREAGISSRVMDDWFKAVRKETGWVSLTKTHFNGSRSLAVSAAESVFMDNTVDSSVPFEAQSDFIAVKARLDGLYSVERGLATVPCASHKDTRRADLRSSDSIVTLPPSSVLSTSDSACNISNSCVPTAPPSPCSTSSIRLPSLVFDPSDSEDEERLPELSVQTVLDDASTRLAPIGKSKADRRLKRTRHCYIERRRHLPEAWSPELPRRPIDSQLFPPQTLTSELGWASPQAPAVVSQTSALSSQSEPEQLPPRSRKRRHSDEDEQPAAKKSRVKRSFPKRGTCKPQAVPTPPPAVAIQAPMEPPNDLDINRLLREFEQDFRTQPETSLSEDPLVTSMPVECNLFNFATDEAQPTSGVIPLCTVDMPITAVDNDSINWEQVLALVPSTDNDDSAALQDRQFDEFLAAFTNSSALVGLENETSTSGDGTALSAIQVNDIQDALDLAPAAAASSVTASSPPSSEGDSIWEDLFGPEDFLSSFVTEDLQLATLDQLLGDTSDTLGSPSAPDALGEIASALPTALVS